MLDKQALTAAIEKAEESFGFGDLSPHDKYSTDVECLCDLIREGVENAVNTYLEEVK